jgi:hypothetical protein
MSEENVAAAEGAAKRPTFLTVLCILTFIGSGWGLISAIAMTDPVIDAYAGYYKWVQVLLCLGTLFGALQMWQLKKTGLYIWTAAEVISVVLMWVVVKGLMASLVGEAGAELADEYGSDVANMAMTGANAMVESMLNMMLIIGSIFPAVFVLLYWLNAKHLK